MAARPTSQSDLDSLVVPQIGLDVQDFLSGLPARYRQLPDQISDVLTKSTNDTGPPPTQQSRLARECANMDTHLEGEQRRAKQPLIAPSRT